jgi:hypothetical protein
MYTTLVAQVFLSTTLHTSARLETGRINMTNTTQATRLAVSANQLLLRSTRRYLRHHRWRDRKNRCSRVGNREYPRLTRCLQLNGGTKYGVKLQYRLRHIHKSTEVFVVENGSNTTREISTKRVKCRDGR